MNISVFSTSIQTSNAVPSAAPWTLAIPEGRTGVIEVDYIAISAGGKRISGKKRAVFTTTAGTATIIDTAKDPYLVKDATGFSDTAINFSVSLDEVSVTATEDAGLGNCTWALIISYYIL